MKFSKVSTVVIWYSIWYSHMIKKGYQVADFSEFHITYYIYISYHMLHLHFSQTLSFEIFISHITYTFHVLISCTFHIEYCVYLAYYTSCIWYVACCVYRVVCYVYYIAYYVYRIHILHHIYLLHIPYCISCVSYCILCISYISCRRYRRPPTYGLPHE